MALAPPADRAARPRFVLICHADDPLNREGLARWLASCGDLAGVVELHEASPRKWRRIRREIRRVGWLRFADVLAFRLFYKLKWAAGDAAWERRRLAELCEQYAPLPADLPVLRTTSPNSPAAEAFLRERAPSLVIARCKSLLQERIFSIPTHGTWVMHPGICPQYRNAHGCFWALAQDDREHVGLTLLKVDRGVDTGPVYGYFHCEFDPLAESHHVIQHKAAFDNLPALAAKLREIAAGVAAPLDTRGLPSGEWGQPWLTAYWRYQRREFQRRQHARRLALP